MSALGRLSTARRSCDRQLSGTPCEVSCTWPQRVQCSSHRPKTVVHLVGGVAGLRSVKRREVNCIHVYCMYLDRQKKLINHAIELMCVRQRQVKKFIPLASLPGKGSMLTHCSSAEIPL